MRRIKIFYWILTGLLAAFMLPGGILDVMQIPQAVEVFKHLGYPAYLLPFIGIAKILAVIAILVPGFQILKEWAYAGLVFDLVGAVYSHLSVSDPPSAWGGAVLGLLLVSGSYLFHRKSLNFEDNKVLSPEKLPSDVDIALCQST